MIELEFCKCVQKLTSKGCLEKVKNPVAVDAVHEGCNLYKKPMTKIEKLNGPGVVLG